MNFTIGTLLAFSFAASLIAIAALIWAISTHQFRITESDARTVFGDEEGGKLDDPTSPHSDSHPSAVDPALSPEWRRLLIVMFVTATAWLVFGSIFGLIASLKLHLPDWLTGSAALTFGRMRTMHLNSVIYGFLSLGGVGAALWLVPTLFKTHLHKPRLAMLGAVIWNLAVFAGVIVIGAGWNDGLEWLEIPWQIDIFLAIGGACFAIPLLYTAAARRVNHIYVTGWYYLGGLVWFPVLFLLANLPGVHSGAQQATTNWWFAHNVLGLWLTPLGLGAAYYFIPKIIGKPIYSYRLSLLGFWALALFYSQVGMHHLIGGPVPTWVVSLSVVQSVMMVVPVVAVAINQHTLSLGNLWAWRESLPLRFVALGAILYTLASLQGSLEAVRAFNTVTHFTHYTVAHAHLGAYGFVALVLFGGIYYMLPRVTGRAWPMPWAISLHFWLVVAGFAVYFISLTIGGWLQGLAMLDATRDWLASMEVTLPYLAGRSLGGALMTLGHLVFAANLAVLFFGRTRRFEDDSDDVATPATATSTGA
ncbi:cytochrome c oxidase cbb3-type subunit 1 [Modicisalibacter ilicicola DSM 19980]|uniref:Cytochrome c oxidase cbb3-type subunit 1 n=1 Tax=Modicisalibacter ilicicola DSM 19980 TaxID=1121942 RepID=A0A1M5AWS7_9GAMM|nr:cbb3-type cytochrome c oxidase subunit I [Halomonas ilicicola]SHF34596.1 cytochrome c oxidase cbb3-type subunit 1 [Halomonas ilicicola DSM 19980]